MTGTMVSELVYALRPEQWCTEVLKFKPDPWQTDVMHARKHLHIRASRRIGKTFVCAAICLHRALYKPGIQIILIAPTFSQAALLSETIASLIQRLPAKPEMLNESQSVLKFKNGSIIRTLQGSEADSLRGYGADLVVVDEAAFVDQRTYDAITAFTANTNGQWILCSTPNGQQGAFYELFVKQNQLYQFLELPWYVCPRIKPEFIENERQTKPINVFNQEYMVMWGAMDEGLWSSESIEACFHQPHKNPQSHFISWDVAGSGADASVVLVSGKDAGGNLVILDMIKFQPRTNLEDQVDFVVRLMQAYPHAKLGVDRTGIGQGPTDSLTKRGVAHTQVMFTSGNTVTRDGVKVGLPKSEAVSKLTVLIQTGKLRFKEGITYTDMIKRQMHEYTAKTQASGNIKYEGAGSNHDDIISALFICAFLAEAAIPMKHFIISGDRDAGRNRISFEPGFAGGR